jgi:hypothetical protein
VCGAFLVAGLVTIFGKNVLADSGNLPQNAAPAAASQDETALTAKLRPAPQSLPAQEQEKLSGTLSRLLEERKALEQKLVDHFANYGAEIDIHSPQYPQYVKDKSDILAANAALLARMREYNASVLAALRSYIRHLTIEMDRMKEDLIAQQRSYANEANAFEDLADMSEHERDKFLDELRDCAKESAMEAGQAGAAKALETAAKISPTDARHIIARLQKAGADNPDLLELVRTIGNAKNKGSRLKAGKRLYKMLNDEATIWKLNSMADRQEYLAALIEIISWVSPSPWLKVCAEGLFDSAKADLTVWFVLGREETVLASATETELRQLKLITEKFVSLARARNQAQQELGSE